MVHLGRLVKGELGPRFNYRVPECGANFHMVVAPSHVVQVNCGNCKRTLAYKKADAAHLRRRY